jgi:orotidine-5'-phosphate decarboxylase
MNRDLTPRERIVVALDTPDLESALALARTLRGDVGWFKAGLELFVSGGPHVVTALRETGLPVFLDLKLHDIPNTVRAAAREAGRLGAGWLTVHASGGRAMIEAAVAGAREGAEAAGLPPPVILGVTVLTSLDDGDLDAVGLSGPSGAAVTRLARLAVDAGAGGIVCSPEEVRAVREAVGPAPLLVTPGVRPAGADRGDQARVATPKDAVAAGSDYLVIGRPIRSAPDPARAARDIAASLST